MGRKKKRTHSLRIDRSYRWDFICPQRRVSLRSSSFSPSWFDLISKAPFQSTRGFFRASLLCLRPSILSSYLMLRQLFIHGYLYLDPKYIISAPTNHVTWSNKTIHKISWSLRLSISIDRIILATDAGGAGDPTNRRQRVNVFFSSREKLNACRRAHHFGARANYIITKFSSNTSQSKKHIATWRTKSRSVTQWLLSSAARGKMRSGKEVPSWKLQENCKYSGAAKSEFRCSYVSLAASRCKLVFSKPPTREIYGGIRSITRLCDIIDRNLRFW